MRKLSKVTRNILLLVCAVSLIGAPNANAKKWFYGLGTGFTFMNAEGDQGLHTPLFGPIQAEIDLDPNDFQDLMKTGFRPRWLCDRWHLDNTGVVWYDETWR